MERPLRLGGIELGTRMTVVRLPGGGLFLHSPVALDDTLRVELLRVGAPRFAIAPNRFHHLFLADYRRVFLDVALHGAPGLAEKRSDLCFDAVLTGEAAQGWAGQIDQEFFGGLPLVNEVAFFHRESRSLMLCDLAFHLGPEAPLATRVAFRLVGGYGRLGPTQLEKFLVRDRTAARVSLDRVLAWDFDRVIVSHGTVVETGGRDALAHGYRWLLR